MRLGQRKPVRTSKLHSFWWFAVLVLVFVVGLIGGGRGWYRTLVYRLPDLVRRARNVLSAQELPTLIVDMDFADYDTLLDQRAEALRSGVCVSSGQDFVPATVRVDDTRVPVRMRLIEGPAEHLGEDEKWGFEVRTRDEQRIHDLSRFYLQDPASNNWLNQWAFAQALRREGILTARYRFVRLIFNGDDRGIYALQEGFGAELLEAQGRPGGVIVEFDADLLWESIAHFQGDLQAAYADPVANLSASDFQYFEIDTFRDAVIAQDPELSAQKERAIELLHSLQSGQRAASQVFEVEQYGRFLALVDLWGATDGVSLVNLKYYYNLTTDRLEPIGFNANALASKVRLSLAATYGDSRLQAAYVQEAVRIGQPEYLDRLQEELEEDWRRLERALSREFGDLAPPWDALRKRQEHMRRSLNPVQPVFAYLATPSSVPPPATYALLRIGVGNVLNLPVEIVGFDIDGATFLPADPQWVRASSTDLLTDHTDVVVLRAFDAARSPVVRYVQFDIPLTTIHRVDKEIDFNREMDIYIATRILGHSSRHLTPARHGLPSPLPVGARE